MDSGLSIRQQPSNNISALDLAVRAAPLPAIPGISFTNKHDDNLQTISTISTKITESAPILKGLNLIL